MYASLQSFYHSKVPSIFITLYKGDSKPAQREKREWLSEDNDPNISIKKRADNKKNKTPILLDLLDIETKRSYKKVSEYRDRSDHPPVPL